MGSTTASSSSRQWVVFIVFLWSSVSSAIPLPCPEFNEDINVVDASWIARGPGGYYPEPGLGATDDDNVLSAGAIQDAVEGANGTWFVGTVNGGVWRTTSDLADSTTIHWKPVTDGQPVRCSSISAITTGKSFDQPNIVVAGCGASTSSEQGTDWNVVNSGPWGGIMVSFDSGDTWSMHDGFDANYYVSSIKILPWYSSSDEIVVFVGARSHYYDKNSGGIWRGNLLDNSTPFVQTLESPIFNMAVSGINVLATVPYDASDTLLLSTDGGLTFESWSDGLDWSKDDTEMEPYYPTIDYNSDGSKVFCGSLTVNPSDATQTSSSLFWRSTDLTGSWTELVGGPSSLDDDAMPKDRMAVLADPTNETQIYVVGNGGHVAWRVDFINDVWTTMLGDDTLNDAEPHVDCRNLAFQQDENRLILVSDGGIFARDHANASGGVWRSLNGDINSLEFLDAKYDPDFDGFISAAQDNFVQISAQGGDAASPALGVVGGDGTVVAIDYASSPHRLFGCIQFLGQNGDDTRRRRRRRLQHRALSKHEDDEEQDDDDDYSGLRMFQGDLKVDIHLLDYFQDEGQFPFFVQSFDVNHHTQYDGTKLVIWANSSMDNSQPAGFYEYKLPSTFDTNSTPSPNLIASTYIGETSLNVYKVIAGGVLVMDNGTLVDDETLLIGLSNSYLLIKSILTDGEMLAKSLPVSFATPYDFGYDPVSGDPILGPVTHGKTCTLAVAPHNTNTIVVTGWLNTIEDNGNADDDDDEVILLTEDGGDTWTDIMGDLLKVTASVGKVRPSSLLVMEVAGDDDSSEGDLAVVVGTVSGVYVTYLSDESHSWSRVGFCGDFPLVLVMSLSYEPSSDTLIAATFGRGVYTISESSSYFKKNKKKPLISN